MPLDEIADVTSTRPILSHATVFAGRVWDVASEEIDLGAAGHVTRDFVAHSGAVAVVAINEAGQIYLVHQYRHPVGRFLWEPPAGLLDVEGEDPLAAAKRELWEEADLTADTWDVLIDFATSPGGSSEAIRVYLARDVHEVPPDQRHAREAEELDMSGQWFEVEDVLKAALDGRVWGPTTIVGAFAVDAARRAQWRTLRPADAPWDKPRGRQ